MIERIAPISGEGDLLAWFCVEELVEEFLRVFRQIGVELPHEVRLAVLPVLRCRNGDERVNVVMIELFDDATGDESAYFFEGRLRRLQVAFLPCE